MKTIRRLQVLAAGLVLFGVCGQLLASTDETTSPERLAELVGQSDFIVVASCIKTQSVNIAEYTLQFAVRKSIKGSLGKFTLVINQNTSSAFYAVTGQHPSLIFLKNGPDGTLELVTSHSAVVLKNGDENLPAELARELELRSMPAGPQKNSALKNFLLPLLSTGKNSYTEENMAEDLLDLCQSNDVHLSQAEVTLVSRVATNTDDYKLALPLALVLAREEAPQADAVCLHVLTDTDELKSDPTFRLAPMLANRAQLRGDFVQKIEDVKDSRQIDAMLTQLYLVDPDGMDAIYERLWKNNPSSRPEVEYELGRSKTPARQELLRRLKAGPAPQ